MTHPKHVIIVLDLSVESMYSCDEANTESRCRVAIHKILHEISTKRSDVAAVSIVGVKADQQVSIDSTNYVSIDGMDRDTFINYRPAFKNYDSSTWEYRIVPHVVVLHQTCHPTEVNLDNMSMNAFNNISYVTQGATWFGISQASKMNPDEIVAISFSPDVFTPPEIISDISKISVPVTMYILGKKNSTKSVERSCVQPQANMKLIPVDIGKRGWWV
jgi:hypothetical protein